MFLLGVLIANFSSHFPVFHQSISCARSRSAHGLHYGELEGALGSLHLSSAGLVRDVLTSCYCCMNRHCLIAPGWLELSGFLIFGSIHQPVNQVPWQAVKRLRHRIKYQVLAWLLLTRFTLACKKCSEEIAKQAIKSFWQFIYTSVTPTGMPDYSGDRVAVDRTISWLHRWMSYSHVTEERWRVLTPWSTLFTYVSWEELTHPQIRFFWEASVR